MGGMQTVLAFLAVMLFSSMTLNSYNNLLRQGDVMEASYLNLQAQEIVERYFEKVECNILAGTQTPAYWATGNHIEEIIPDTVWVKTADLQDSTAFTFTWRKAHLCDKTCDTSNPKSHTVLVSLILSTTYGNRTITVGTVAKPKSAIFSEGL